MTKVAFRFDIDSHKCMRDGVPLLLNIAKEYGVPFTFYVNFGRAISIIDTLTADKSEHVDDVKMLSALEKLGRKDYLYAAMINPKMTKYKKELQMLFHSSCEVGIHGGRNHSHWYKSAAQWDYDKVYSEIQWALGELKKIAPEYKVDGFAAPGFVTSEVVNKVLLDCGFKYCSNTYCNGIDEIVSVNDDFAEISVNLCGEPGGIAFWEYAKAMNWSDEQTLQYFMNMVEKHEKVLVFDHPYFAAVNKASLIRKTIETLLANGHEIVTVNKLIG